MHDAAQEIKSKIDIVDFLGSLITLHKAGRNYKALCPFHQEKTPSFMVSSDRQNWRCFGACQTGGDIISFLMKWENFTFYEALTELANKTGVPLSEFDIEDESYKRKNHLSKINNEAVRAYTYYLNHPSIGLEAREYLTGRDLNNKIITTFALGYAPATKKALVSHLLKKGFLAGDLVEVGLAIKTYSGELIDRFHHRLMFPIYDPRGIVIGFSGRTLEKGQTKEAKYINTPETYLYKKRETLYGIHLTKKNIQDKDCAVIVEGEFDMISCFKSGITNVVAIKGSALTEQQLVLLSRYTKTLTLALDSDTSGLSTTKRVLPETEKMEFKVQIAQSLDGKDPDEALKNNPLHFKKAIEKPIPVYDFVIEYGQKKYSLKDPYQKASFIKEVGPTITKIENPIIKAHYVKKLSTLLEVDIETIEKGIIPKAKEIPKSTLQSTPSDKQYQKEFFIASLFFQSKDPYTMYDTIFNQTDELFSSPSIVKIFQYFNTFKNNHQSFDVRAFAATLPPELMDTYDALCLTDLSDIKFDEFDKRLIKSAMQLRHSVIKMKMKTLFAKNNENNDVNKEIQSLTKELSEIEKRLSLL